MFEFQSHLIFPVHAVPAAGPLPPGAKRLSVTTADGKTLAGVHITPREPDGSSTLLLAFGGNAWNAQDVAVYLHDLFPQHSVLAFHYRGYAPSTGSPSAEALIADAPLVFDAAVKAARCACVIAVGFSIGTGVAATLSAKRKLDGLILVTPFDSLKSVAQSMYPWLPIGPFFEHEIDAATALKDSKVPVAIIAAARDEIIPRERIAALRDQVPTLVFERVVKGAGHNDIYARSKFHEAMRTALELIRMRPTRKGTR